MKNACDPFRHCLLDRPGADDEALRRHLGECPDCRRLAEAWEVMRAAPRLPVPEIPPEHVDFAVRREAVAVAEHRALSHHALARHFSWLSVAACAAIVVGVIYSLLKTPPSEAPGTPIATSGLAHAEAADWRQLDLAEDFFMLDAEIEITFAMLSPNGYSSGP